MSWTHRLRHILATLPHPARESYRWRVAPGWEYILPLVESLPLNQWLTQARAERVASHDIHRRFVYRVCLSDRVVYVKHQKYTRLGKRIFNLFRGSESRREWNNTARASKLGVPAAPRVALAEKRRRGLVRESLFLVEAIEGAEPIDRFARDRRGAMPPASRQRGRRWLVERLARFMAKMHAAGVWHGDLHAGNILVVADELETAEKPGLHLIDFNRAKFSKPFTWKRSLASLAILLSEWIHQTTTAERWRFLKVYLHCRPELRVPSRNRLIRQLNREMLAHVSRVHRRRDRGPLRNTSDFVAETRGKLRLHAVRDLPEPIRNELFRESEANPAPTGEESIENTNAILTLRVEVPWGEGTTPVVVRRYRPRGAWRALCDRFRRSRAIQNWRRGHALLARGIATSRPLAVCDGCDFATRRRWPRWLRPRESRLAVEWIDGAENLHSWASRLAIRPPSERSRRAAACAEQLGRLVGRMHAGGVSHRDLRGSSLLIVEHGRAVRAWLIDMEGVEFHKHLSTRRRETDLARLAADIEAHRWVPPSIHYRFVLAYARQFPQGSIDPRQLWRDVAWQVRRERREREKRAAA